MRRIVFWCLILLMNSMKRVAYIFWSIFTSLAPSLFYFSVWELAIAGHELALVTSLSPILLAITPFMDWCRTRSGRTIFHLLSLTGLAAFAINSPLYRLLVVSFANAVAWVGAAVDWTDTTSVNYQSLRSYSRIETEGNVLTGRCSHGFRFDVIITFKARFIIC